MHGRTGTLGDNSDGAGISAAQAAGGQGEDARPPVASSLLCAGGDVSFE